MADAALLPAMSLANPEALEHTAKNADGSLRIPAPPPPHLLSPTASHPITTGAAARRRGNSVSGGPGSASPNVQPLAHGQGSIRVAPPAAATTPRGSSTNTLSTTEHLSVAYVNAIKRSIVAVLTTVARLSGSGGLVQHAAAPPVPQLTPPNAPRLQFAAPTGSASVSDASSTSSSRRESGVTAGTLAAAVTPRAASLETPSLFRRMIGTSEDDVKWRRQWAQSVALGLSTPNSSRHHTSGSRHRVTPPSSTTAVGRASPTPGGHPAAHGAASSSLPALASSTGPIESLVAIVPPQSKKTPSTSPATAACRQVPNAASASAEEMALSPKSSSGSLVASDALVALVATLAEVYKDLDRLPQLMSAHFAAALSHHGAALSSTAGARRGSQKGGARDWALPWVAVGARPGDAGAMSLSDVASSTSVHPTVAHPPQPGPPPISSPRGRTSIHRGVSFVAPGELHEAAAAASQQDRTSGPRPPSPHSDDDAADNLQPPPAAILSSVSFLSASPVDAPALHGGPSFQRAGAFDRRESVMSNVAPRDLVHTTRKYSFSGPEGGGSPHSGAMEGSGFGTNSSSDFINQYILLKTLGEGGQGEVFLAYDTITEEMRAIKRVKRPLYWNEVQSRGPTSTPPPSGQSSSSDKKPSKAQRKALQLAREIAIMKRCRHQNVVALYEVIDDPRNEKVYLVMQNIEHGPLLQIDDEGFADTVFSAEQVALYGRQICAGLCYLHEHNVVHRDIKPDNILLGSDDTVFLADFGVSELFSPEDDGSIQGKRGTKLFLAPELANISGDGRVADGKLVDVWALGMTLYIMLFGQIPWEFTSVEQYFVDIASVPLSFPPEPDDPQEGRAMELWKPVMFGMMTVDPATRWSPEKSRAEIKKLHVYLSRRDRDVVVADAELDTAITLAAPAP